MHSSLNGVTQALLDWRQNDAVQAKRLDNIARLFAALLVLTLVARGTAAATMPVVSTQPPVQAELARTCSISATVTARAGQPFRLPGGLLITEVPVRCGQQVAEGVPLVLFDAADVEQALARAKAELAQLKLSYQNGMKTVEADAWSVAQNQQKLDAAYAEAEKVRLQGEETVRAAEQAVTDAQAAYDDAIRQEEDAVPPDVVEEMPEPSSTPLPETEGPLAVAPETLPDPVQQALDALMATQAALEASRTEAANAYAAALAVAQSAEDGRNSALHSYEQQARSAAETTAANRAAAGITKTDIAAKEQQIAQLEAVKASGYAFRAPYAGTVTELDVAAGNVSPSVGGLLAPGSDGCTLTFSLTKEWAALAAVGTAVTARQGQQQADLPIAVLGPPDEDGTVQAALELETGGGWQPGTATVTVTAALGRYLNCLPPAAIHTDSAGSFVYIVEERDTVLGRRNVLARIPVTVEQTGDTLTAVSGALSGSDAVVISADRPLTAGAHVRLA